MTATDQPDPANAPDDGGAAPGDGARPLRILIGADTFAPDVNGAAKFAERLAAGLKAKGHDVHVLAPSATSKHGTWQEEHEGQSLTMHRLRSWRWYPHDWLRFALPWTIRRNSAKLLDELKPDVIHTQSYLVVGRGLSLEGKKRGIRMVATNHLMPENMVEFSLIPSAFVDTFTKGLWKMGGSILRLNDAVTTPTQKAADFLEKYTGMTGVKAVSCGINAGNYTPSFAPRTENRILFVGRVTGEKHIDVLLGAVKLLPAELDAKLTIVGNGDQKHNLEVLADKLGIADRVDFVGYVTDEELRDNYTRATVFAMPSIAELQSIATMEAMASGLPVVAANAMALPHLVHDGENGFLFEPGNSQDLADKLTTVLTATPERLDEFKNTSLEMIKIHDIDTTISTFENLYRGVAS